MHTDNYRCNYELPFKDYTRAHCLVVFPHAPKAFNGLGDEGLGFGLEGPEALGWKGLQQESTIHIRIHLHLHIHVHIHVYTHIYTYSPSVTPDSWHCAENVRASS